MIEYAKQALKGDQRAGARLIRLLEEQNPEGTKGLEYLFPHSGKAAVIGITGPPGAGKSTIIEKLITEYRQKKLKVGVIAVDPSSPNSGGAILGDRLRMRNHADDPGVFIRSIATRGYQGGLSRAVFGTMIVLDAMGYDPIIIETVGIGQDEVEIDQIAHTTAVISIPGMGDHIQAMKAGILEIGDIFVMNKSDHPNADMAMNHLNTMLQSKNIPEDEWKPLLIQTVGKENKGITELIRGFDSHREHLMNNHRFDEISTRRSLYFFKRLITDHVTEKTLQFILTNPKYITLTDSLKQFKTDPFSAAKKMTENLKYSLKS